MDAYTCTIIGDGTKDNPFRPAIHDVKDAQGNPAFNWTAEIPTDAKGKPINPTCKVAAQGNDALLIGNAMVTKVAPVNTSDDQPR